MVEDADRLESFFSSLKYGLRKTSKSEVWKDNEVNQRIKE